MEFVAAGRSHVGPENQVSRGSRALGRMRSRFSPRGIGGSDGTQRVRCWIAGGRESIQPDYAPSREAYL